MKTFWLILGWSTLALGMIGVFLPIVPTVPFLLVAVWAFAKSSPRLRMKILRHPTYGPPIRAWQRNGAISRPGKIASTVAMGGSVGIAILLKLPPYFILVQAVICGAVAIYILTRPDH